MTDHLFSPLEIRGVTLRNRIAVSPMCEYSSIDGFANDWHLVHLGSRAVGGAALVFTEATAVTADGRISPDDLGIWKDEHVEYLSRITKFVEEHGAVPGIQLAHAGRKASTASPWKGGGAVAVEDGGWRPIRAPSAIAFRDDDIVPQALDRDGIAKISTAFRDAAKRSLDAGFRVIELHAAHGYLLHEFMSPLANERDDDYGGSFENRIRIVVEVVDAIRTVWPEEYPLFVRISASDWADGGWTLDDSVDLARVLKDHAVDLIDCSSGGIIPRAKIAIGPGYQVPFAHAVRNEVEIMTGAVGLITSPQQADQIVRNFDADLVIIARQLLREPYWPLRAAKDLGVDVAWPEQYLRAK